ncbi:hypothetical protein LIA77_05422 [Sarocladium implicatum]|nr:hypothetical protein LIA77_05422 [Sarocladium implicatum]
MKAIYRAGNEEIVREGVSKGVLNQCMMLGSRRGSVEAKSMDGSQAQAQAQAKYKTRYCGVARPVWMAADGWMVCWRRVTSREEETQTPRDREGRHRGRPACSGR